MFSVLSRNELGWSGCPWGLGFPFSGFGFRISPPGPRLAACGPWGPLFLHSSGAYNPIFLPTSMRVVIFVTKSKEIVGHSGFALLLPAACASASTAADTS